MASAPPFVHSSPSWAIPASFCLNSWLREIRVTVKRIVMQIEHDSAKVLDELMAYAGQYAKDRMEKQGYMPPTLFVEGAEGTIGYSPPLHLLNVCYDDLAEVGREMAIGYCAMAVVLAGEAWTTRTHPGVQRFVEQGQDECVAFIGESRFEKINKMLPIIRFQGGQFAGFDEAVIYREDEIHGRRAELMCYGVCDEKEREEMRRLLRRDGHASHRNKYLAVRRNIGANPRYRGRPRPR